MILRILILTLLLGGFPALADDISDFNNARRYFLKDHPKSFAAAAAKISADNPYRPLINYWQAVIKLRRQQPQAMETLLTKTNSTYVRQKGGEQLSEYYANKKSWEKFTQYADYSSCGKMLTQLRKYATDTDEFHRLWDEEKRFQDTLCITTYKHARRQGILSEDDLWRKLRNLASDRQLSASRRFIRHFKLPIAYKQLRKTVLRPVQYIRGKHPLDTRAQRELVMIAAMSGSTKQLSTVIKRWKAFSQYYNEDENSHVWAKIAQRAAVSHKQSALALYRLAPLPNSYNEKSRAWRVRAALRADDFADAIRTIQSMPSSESSLSAWRYWHAVALQRTGNKQQSQQIMRKLAKEEDDYYGLLAREESNLPLLSPLAFSNNGRPQAHGDFATAISVWRAGQNSLARRIWKRAVAKADAPTILAAAQAAEKAGWFLASINAANVTQLPAAHQVRYPRPYQETIDKYSHQFGLEPAFVYALIRQESRFMHNAISSAKARGLMQVLPSTAAKVARSHGYNRYRLSRLTRPDTNVIIGTSYLKDLAKRFDAHPVQVAAAYNAGPGRAARWRKRNKQNDALVQVENIPFLETRLYVKAVLGNRVHYGFQLGENHTSMRALVEQKMRHTN
ncbi:MAG: transglycosylase SLT domain-containing protein [Gammaproteobacteria bacterium WSBS_2016_MAG_OTU1]